MKHEILQDALNEISDNHIAEAAAPCRKKRAYWIGPIAAVLALVILVTSLYPSLNAQASGLIAAPTYPEMAPYPKSLDDRSAINAWRTSRNKQHNQPRGYANGTEAYFTQVIPALLSGAETENATCSPLNTYMALAMLAEITGGNSQAQILDLLGASSIENLRTQASHVWNAHYCDDGAAYSILANSLWLDSKYSYTPAAVNNLATYYYASVYQGDLGSWKMDRALQSWLNEQTGGLLKEQAQKTNFEDNTALALASTVLYQAKWSDDFEFSEENNTQGIFHGAESDVTCTFMNHRLRSSDYFQGADFSAIYLDLDDNNRMWLILPNKGKTPQSVLESGEAVSAILGNTDTFPLSAKVDLSIPKFDITAETDFAETLKNLGITDIFNPDIADFSSILPDQQASLSSADHAVRVAIDEEGVTAAAYTVMQLDVNSAPEQIIQFTLDRPFLFMITSPDKLPLFAGIVNQP